MPKNSCIMQIWAESGKSALPICNYSQILYQFLTFTQNLKRSRKYVLGKVSAGFLTCTFVLAVLNLLFWILCILYTRDSGFEIHLSNFIISTILYILPNMLMIVSMYALIALIFKNPLPGVPLLILYMVYSNMGGRNAEGVYGYVGRPFAIMVRFPGQFFDTAPPPMALLNQSFLILASVAIILITMQIWKRRRM